MKKTLFSFAALGALCAAPLFAQEVPRANQPDPPVRPGQADDRDAEGARDRADQPRAVPAGQNAEERAAGQTRPAARPAGQAQPGERAGTQRTEVQDTQSTDFAQHVAACLILANEAEIAITEPAIEKLQNEQARELAQMIVKDHTEFVSKLKQHAPQAANLKLNVQGASRSPSGAAASARSNENADDANSTTDPAHADATAAQRSSGESMADKALRVDKAYHEKKVQMISERLNKEQGQNFDQAFLGCQVAGHIGMVAKLQALQQEAQGDQEFVQLLKQGEQSAQKHLQEAEQLMNQEKNDEQGQDANAREGAAPRTTRPAPSGTSRPAPTPER